jgi:hypothetical protein
LAVAAFILATGFGSGERLFAPGADLWPRWQAHDAASRATIDHGAWDVLLRRYVRGGEDGLNLFAYGAVSPADRGALAAYIDGLSRIPISRHNRAEQLAYWINLYNALTVRVVLDHYPVKSIRDIDISPGFFADGPWGKKLATVEGEAVSLNDIEHRILRPIWRDPRLHYAVNCASIGCPNLRTRAWTAATVEATLEQAATDYVNSPRGVSVRDGTVTISKIYDWFHEDFGGTDAGVLNHLLKYASPAMRQRLAAIGAIHDVTYDWRLNDTGL